MNPSGKNAVKFDLTASTKAARLSRRNEQMIDPFRTSGSSPHAHTMFAESKKKSDEKKRGRFNVGEAYFLHTTSIVQGPENPALGSTVKFDGAPAVRNGKRPQAINAVIVEPVAGGAL